MFISFLSPAKFKRLSFKRLKMESTAFPINNMDNLYTTQIIKMNPLQLQDDSFSVPVSIIQSGNVVAFPTETVYGLGANALDGNACKKIFQVKNRPSDNPLIVHISNEEMLLKLIDGEIPDVAKLLIKAFWPGPLTILFKKSLAVPEEVTCAQPTVAIRMPIHPIARKLIELSNCPIAAPSANLSGRPSPTSAQHVFTDLQGRLECIIDGGDCDVGVESTVIDIQRKMILRPGGVTFEQLRHYIEDLTVFSKEKDDENLVQSPPTPGMKYRHYSPSAQVLLLIGENMTNMKAFIEQKFNELEKEDKTLGLIHTHSDLILSDAIKQSKNVKIIDLSNENSPSFVAKGLFSALRELDALGVSLIIMEGISESNEGLAVMNRIEKAASIVVNTDNENNS